MQLLRQGHSVTACLGSTRGRLPPATPGLREIHGDLAGGLPLPHPIDAIVHAAARSPAPGVSPEDMHRSNVIGTRNVVEHAKHAGARFFIYLSSLSIYGRIDAAVVDEATPIQDPDPYGISKRLGEELLAAEQASLRSLSIRLPGVIGPRSVRNWLTHVLDSAREGRDISVYNPDAPFNNAAHVSDLAQFVCNLLNQDWRGHDVVTIGAAGRTTVGEAVRLLVDAFGGTSRIRVEVVPKRSFLISSARACECYGYRPMEITKMLKRFATENSNVA